MQHNNFAAVKSEMTCLYKIPGIDAPLRLLKTVHKNLFLTAFKAASYGF